MSGKKTDHQRESDESQDSLGKLTEQDISLLDENGHSKDEYRDENERDHQRNSLKDSAISFIKYVLHAVKTLIPIDALSEERAFALLFLPSQIIHDFTYMGWCLFIVSYGVSVGIDEALAPLLAVAGAAGGFVSRIILVVVLHFRPVWSSVLYAVNIFIFIVGLFLHPVSSSFTYLTAVSVAVGFGMYGAVSTYYGAMSMTLSDRHFPDLLAFSYFLSGIGIPVSGALTGYLYDVTGSFEIVFMIFGGAQSLGLVMSMGYFVLKRTKRNVLLVQAA